MWNIRRDLCCGLLGPVFLCVRLSSCSRLLLEVGYFVGRRHLPVIELKRVA